MTCNRKIAFKTLGCKLNQFETDALASEVVGNGYQIVPFSKEADVYIINTCTVTNQSDHKSRNIISQAARKNKDAVVLVTGCMADSGKERIEALGSTTFIVPNATKTSIASLLDAHFKGEIVDPGKYQEDRFGFKLADSGFHTRSFVKIQDGCNNFCSYCIIPLVRGREISRPMEDVLNNISRLVSKGVKEIVLTGINISKYNDQGRNFETLISRIIELEADFRVRISSVEPEGFTKKFYQLFKHPKLCPSLHLCLQSGADSVLNRMNRNYSLKEYIEIMDGIRKVVPDFNFTTDIITGFPQETDEEFQDSVRSVDELFFTHVHTFKYSVRKGTRAERFDGHISEKVKNERSESIRLISEKNKEAYRKSFVNKPQRVLIEKERRHYVQGYGQHYVPVRIYDSALKRNTFADVIITGYEMIDQEIILTGEKV